MSLAIDEIYRSAANGNCSTPSQQAHVMLNAVGKMLALENLKLRAGIVAEKRGVGPEFFLGVGERNRNGA